MDDRKLIYLASPYTHPDQDVRQQRYDQVCQAAANYILSSDVFVYSPIAHTAAIERKMDGDFVEFSYWQEFDYRMIRHCDEFWVLRLDGWKESVGVTAEIKYAKSIGKRVMMVDTNG